MKNIKFAITTLFAAGSLASGQLSSIDNDAAYNSDLSGLATSVLDGTLVPRTDAAWAPGSTILPSLLPGEIWDFVFIGEFADWKNNLSIGLNLNSDGGFGAQSSLVNIFEDIDMSNLATGDFRRLIVDFETEGFYDFILNSTDENAGGVNGGKWRMFTPGYDEPISDFEYGYFGAQETGEAGPYILFAFEDWNQNSPGSDGGPEVGAPDMDRNDTVFAMRYGGMASSTVPEPSTYGILGASVLFGLIMVRRIKKRKS